MYHKCALSLITGRSMMASKPSRKASEVRGLQASLWRQISSMLSDVSVSCVWCPSHGKQEHWAPPEGHDRGLAYRKMNEIADAACTRVLRGGGAHHHVTQAAHDWISSYRAARLWCSVCSGKLGHQVRSSSGTLWPLDTRARISYHLGQVN